MYRQHCMAFGDLLLPRGRFILFVTVHLCVYVHCHMRDYVHHCLRFDVRFMCTFMCAFMCAVWLTGRSVRKPKGPLLGVTPSHAATPRFMCFCVR
jgi:hypothetical protein